MVDSRSPSPVYGDDIDRIGNLEERELPLPAPAVTSVPTHTDTTVASIFADSCGEAGRDALSHSSQSSTMTDQRRSTNPVFSLSPRVASNVNLWSCASNSLPKVIVHIGRGEEVEELTYCVGTCDGRREFLANCLKHVEDMDEQNVLDEIIPGMLLLSTFGDSCCAVADVLPSVVKRVCEVRRDLFVYFMGLIMGLCCSPDLSVVRHISSSLRDIVRSADNEVVDKFLVPFVIAMQTSQWSSPRAVAASLLGVVAVRRATTCTSGWSVEQYFDRFVKLTGDKNTHVRQVCAESMYTWVSVAEVHCLNVNKMPLALVSKCMSTDESDAVRCCYVAQLLQLGEKIGREQTTNHLQDLFVKASNDRSWRVRYYAARYLSDFARLCMKPSDLVEVFIKLCADEMREVRRAAVEQFGAFTPDTVTMQVTSRACISACLLAADKEAVVREGVARQLHLLLSPMVARVYSPHQRRRLLMLLTDASYDVAEAATRNAGQVVNVLRKYVRPGDTTNPSSFPLSSISTTKCSNGTVASGPDNFNGSVVTYIAGEMSAVVVGAGEGTTNRVVAGGCIGAPMAEELRSLATSVVLDLVRELQCICQSINWRMREAAVDVLRYFCPVFTREEFTPYVGIVRRLLRDPVSAVRLRSSDTIAVVARSYGPEMAVTIMSEMLYEFNVSAHTSFLLRMVAIRCFSSIIPLVDGLYSNDLRRHALYEKWLAVMTLLAEDRVPNVRLVLARSIAENWDWFSSCSAKQDVIRRCVERLKGDEDANVAEAVRSVQLRPCKV